MEEIQTAIVDGIVSGHTEWPQKIPISFFHIEEEISFLRLK